MKKRPRIIVAFFILFAHTSSAELACPTTEYRPGYESNLPILDGEELIQVGSSLFPNSKIQCQVSFNHETRKNNKRTRIEEGTYDGVKYRVYFSDGSGSIQGLPTNTLDYVRDQNGANWSMQCKLDEMNDTHWCSLRKEDLRVGIWKDGAHFVSVGSSHYPGSTIAVRVDKKKPIYASEKIGFTKAQSKKIIEQLKKGNSVLTRYQEWPYESNIDTSMDIFGFPQAWAILQKVYSSVGSQEGF